MISPDPVTTYQTVVFYNYQKKDITMSNFLKMSRAAAVLMLIAAMSLECQMVFAEPDAEQDATVIIVDQNETLAAADEGTQAVDVNPAGADASDPSAQDDTANAEKAAKKPEKKGKEADASIPGTNPEDASKHPAWRKREAKKSIGDLKENRRLLMEQGGQ